LRGDAGIVECAYVASQAVSTKETSGGFQPVLTYLIDWLGINRKVTELPFFATQVKLGRGGAEEIYQLGPLNEYERVGLEEAKKELAGSIEKGVTFIRK
nr:malate dehydrogenase, glyoxysomal [Tanacetum cinerariifolium]